MGTAGLVILLLAVSFFVVVGLSSTSTLLTEASNSNDTSVANAAHSASSIMSPLFTVFAWGIVIVGIYAVIHSYNAM